jgi:uncharacterized protein YndB with AHSA1/START domain
MKQEPFVIERTYNAPAAKVWKAITDKNDMKQWYFDLAEFKPEVGFEFSFTVKEGGFDYVHLCKVTEVVTGKKIAYSWRYKGEPGDSVVSWELFPEGEKTRIKLTHEGLETFPPTRDFAKENFVKGWTHFIGGALPNFVEKTSVV